MGSEVSKIKMSSAPPTVVMMVGLQGTGKTTHCGKLANFFKTKHSKRPLMVACDIYRPAAITQLCIVGESVGVPVFKMDGVKDAVKIPVIGNGDVTDALSAKALIDHTGCDGVMIGRAAQGNPWIFKEVSDYLETGVVPERPSVEQIKETVIRHAELQLQYKGEYTAVREMRKHLSWYTVGYPNSARFRQMINSMESMDELLKSVEQIFGSHK
jgi:hypothetical protein